MDKGAASFAENTRFFRTFLFENEENQLFFAYFTTLADENRMIFTKKSMLNRPKTNEKVLVLINK